MSPHEVVAKMSRLVELYDMPGLEGYDEFTALRGELLDAMRGWAPTTFYVDDEQRVVIYRHGDIVIYSRTVTVPRDAVRKALDGDAEAVAWLRGILSRP